MEPYIRLGEPYSRAELDALRLDGLLVPLSDDCFVPVGTPVTPELRAGSLPEPAPGLAYSHGTAAWLWWGIAPRLRVPELCTVRRRRARAAPDRLMVHEAQLLPPEAITLGHLLVTSGPRTVFDLLRSAVLAGDDLMVWRWRFEALSPAERREVAAYLRGSLHRPHVHAIRKAAGAVLNPYQPPLMR